MGNIKNYDSRRLDIKLSNSDYWDFYLANDYTTLGPSDYNHCLIINFNFNNPSIFTSGSPTTISSLAVWTGATNTGYTLNTIGLTGIDNGLVTFVKDPLDPTNQAMLSALTASTLYIPSGDSRLHLNKVSGMTGNYIYPVDIVTATTGNYAKFNGGFYQGYYKIDGTNYQVLPNRTNNGFVAKCLLYRDDTTAYTGTTLNDTYPNNKGFFFYMGTRAENKFWDLFNGADTGCTSACTATTACTNTVSQWCTIPKESQIALRSIIHTGETITLHPDQNIRTEITNPFLIYGEAGRGGGYYPCSTGPSGFGNETVSTFSGFTKSIEFDNIDYKLDIIDNALGFRVKDDGSIGYRLLTVTGQCSGNTYVSGVTVHEAYSDAGLVPYHSWTNIVIRFKLSDYYTDCDFKIKGTRKGKLMFYINSKLKYTINDFPEFIAKRLDEHMEKQISVPYNISLGGGSQGLIETLTFDGRDVGDLGLPIERNFAGTFIGRISRFTFYDCDLNYIDIQNL
jgi:hypothetical protein